MENLIAGLLLWIGAATGYPVDIPHPQIEYRTSSELSVMHYGSIESAYDVIAIHRKGTIFLNIDFDINNPEDEYALLHENIHYVQYRNGVMGTICRGKTETEAYTFGNVWRRENGLELIQEGHILLMEWRGCPFKGRSVRRYEVEGASPLMITIMEQMFLWLSNNTAYTTGDSIPNVTYATTQKLIAMYFEGFEIPDNQEGGAEIIIASMYQRSSGNIVLPTSYNIHDKEYQSDLFHALVEYVQHINGQELSCVSVIETYNLWNMWRASQGLVALDKLTLFSAALSEPVCKDTGVSIGGRAG